MPQHAHVHTPTHPPTHPDTDAETHTHTLIHTGTNKNTSRHLPVLEAERDERVARKGENLDPLLAALPVFKGLQA